MATPTPAVDQTLPQPNSLPSSTVYPTAATQANEAASKLVESIDDFLADVEKKFRTVSEEILTKLDDMAERCDRLEQDMLLSSTSGGSTSGPGPSLEKDEGIEVSENGILHTDKSL